MVLISGIKDRVPWASKSITLLEIIKNVLKDRTHRKTRSYARSIAIFPALLQADSIKENPIPVLANGVRLSRPRWTRMMEGGTWSWFFTPQVASAYANTLDRILKTPYLRSWVSTFLSYWAQLSFGQFLNGLVMVLNCFEWLCNGWVVFHTTCNRLNRNDTG